jgi:SHS family lactate transporter-like MFS transporter
MASAFIVGYSIGGMFPTYLQKDLQLSPALVALPVMLQSIVFFLSGSFWGIVSDRIGRRIAIIIPALLTIPITPLYLMTGDYYAILGCFSIALAVFAGPETRGKQLVAELSRPIEGWLRAADALRLACCTMTQVAR